jgi:uncharacterized membrane protein YhaH (DUF805 family)
MKTPTWIPILFALTALYDGLLGLLFLIAPGYPFERFDVTPPNHIGYVQFPAAVLLIFALMFVRIALDPRRHRDLILYGFLLKVAYVAVSGWHWFSAGIPGMWKPLTMIDAVTAVLFVVAYMLLGGPGAEKRAPS